MKKKLSLIILSLIIVLSFFNISTSFASSSVEKTALGTTNTYYSYNDATSTLTISGEGDTPTYPSQNSAPWYLYRSEIKHIVVKNGVTSLGNYIFYSTISLEDISLPETLTKIGKNSFVSTGITEIKFPESLVAIDNYAFDSSKLQSVFIPKNVETIGKYSFANSANLENVSFDVESACSIGLYAFENCQSLLSIETSKNLTMGSFSFGYNSGHTALVADNLSIYGYSGTSANVYASSNNISFINLEDVRTSLTLFNETKSELVSTAKPRLFSFTPPVDGNYTIYSLGNTDVSAKLYDENGTLLGEADDIDSLNRNFSLTYNCTSGKAYNISVYGVGVTGVFSIGVVPPVSSISAEFSNPVSFTDYVDAKIINGQRYYDYSGYIDDISVTVNYKTGESKTIFAKDKEFAYIPINVYDTQIENEWTVGENNIYVSYGSEVTSLAVNLVAHSHNYTQNIVSPTISTDGYTEYTCSICNISYKGDYVNRTGKKISGKTVLMTNPDGTYNDKKIVSGAEIYANDNLVATSDENGFFEAFVFPDTYSIKVVYKYSPERNKNIEITSDTDFGNIALIGYDINGDGFINSRDYALFIKMQSSSSQDLALDYNKNGFIDEDDFSAYINFVSIGNFSAEKYSIF